MMVSIIYPNDLKIYSEQMRYHNSWMQILQNAETVLSVRSLISLPNGLLSLPFSLLWCYVITLFQKGIRQKVYRIGNSCLNFLLTQQFTVQCTTVTYKTYTVQAWRAIVTCALFGRSVLHQEVVCAVNSSSQLAVVESAFCEVAFD